MKFIGGPYNGETHDVHPLLTEVSVLTVVGTIVRFEVQQADGLALMTDDGDGTYLKWDRTCYVRSIPRVALEADRSVEDSLKRYVREVLMASDAHPETITVQTVWDDGGDHVLLTGFGYIPELHPKGTTK